MTDTPIPAEPAIAPTDIVPVAEPAPPSPPTPPSTPPSPPTPAPAKPASIPATKPTVLATTAEDDKPAAAPADFPDNWREKLAGEDAKMLETLKRFGSVKALSDGYLALKQKISAGEYQKPLAADATPEQVAEWRKENGIPDKPEAYDLTLQDGLVVGEQDKPLVNEFLTAMHSLNAKPEVVKAAVATYYKIVEQQHAQRSEQDASIRAQSEDALRAEWGADYRRNLTLTNALLDGSAPVGFKERLMGARLADGTLLGDDPDALRFLATTAREINPISTVVPGSGANAAGAIGDEIAVYEKRMREDWTGWHKDAKAQERYRELLSARDRIKAR